MNKRPTRPASKRPAPEAAAPALPVRDHLRAFWAIAQRHPCTFQIVTAADVRAGRDSETRPLLRPVAHAPKNRTEGEIIRRHFAPDPASVADVLAEYETVQSETSPKLAELNRRARSFLHFDYTLHLDNVPLFVELLAVEAVRMMISECQHLGHTAGVKAWQAFLGCNADLAGQWLAAGEIMCHPKEPCATARAVGEPHGGATAHDLGKLDTFHDAAALLWALFDCHQAPAAELPARLIRVFQLHGRMVARDWNLPAHTGTRAQNRQERATAGRRKPAATPEAVRAFVAKSGEPKKSAAVRAAADHFGVKERTIWKRLKADA